MGLSKSTRIMILLGIDSAFFALEFGVGYAVHSLALVADSFHMFNDVLSLCVGLWAVKVARQKPNSKKYTYGWQRAETLGALVNGVFLVALCMSIFLEAIVRFVDPQTVSNPRLVLIVGCFGLASNILGLFLFHEHGHSHGGGGHGHSHGESDTLAAAEEGHSHAATGGQTAAIADEGGNVADVLPQSRIAGWPRSSGVNGNPKEKSKKQSSQASEDFTKSDEEDSTITNSTSPLSMRKSHANSIGRRRRHNSGSSRSRFHSIDDMHVRPASFRNDIIAASRLEGIESRDDSGSEEENAIEVEDHGANENTPLLSPPKVNGAGKHMHETDHTHQHKDDDHAQPEKGGDGGHSHSDLNMRGVFLHVMGDALGNIGVIGSALIIWLTDYSWRFYADPIISLVITVIILASAIPLCQAASKILLQAVPAGISIDEIRHDIEELAGIISCHDLHVWQLSDVKMIASLHVQVEFDFKGEGSARYMQLARAIRHCLHKKGIHHSTIQPEFCLDSEHRHTSDHPSDNEASDGDHSTTKTQKGGKGRSQAASVRSEPEACLLDCGNECDEGSQSCTPRVAEIDSHAEEGHSH